MADEKPPEHLSDPEMSKKTDLKEDPDLYGKTVDSSDPELAIDTAHLEGDDPGSIEFEVESVDDGDSTAVSQRAGHVIRVDKNSGASGGPARYELHGELGSGGMAIVNSALDRQLQRSVAIKRLRKELATSQRSRERFFDEAMVIATLDHPGVVPIFEKGTLPSGEAFYSMKRVTGRTLEDMLSRRAPDDIGRRESIAHFVDIFERICQTMSAAHQRGIVHRDLKPSNVMVDDFGSVLVMDWGLAKRISEDSSEDSKKTVAGALLGTPSYMSPEQAKGEAHRSDCRSDVFSLGVMLYEILTGTNPFDRESIKDSLDVVLHLEPESPRGINPSVDRDLAAICMKAMAKDPVKRYVSARDLADEIRRYREFRPVSVRKPGLIDRASRWWRRNPRLGGATAAMALMILIVAGGLGFQRSVEAGLVKKAYETIEELRADVAKIDAERATIKLRLESNDLGEAETKLLESRLEELEVTREFQLGREESMAIAIAGFTVLQPDKEAQRILRERAIQRITEDLDSRQWLEARLEIESILDGASKENILGWTPDELAKLGENLAAAKQGQKREAAAAW